MRHTDATATPQSTPDAGFGAFTKEFRSRTGSRRVGKAQDKFQDPAKLRRLVGDLIDAESAPLSGFSKS